MSYLITGYRADGTSRAWADVNDEDALRLLAFWDRGLRLPAVRQDLGQNRERRVLINSDKFEDLEVEATPLVFFGSGTIVTVPFMQVESSLGCGIVASTAGGLIDPQEG